MTDNGFLDALNAPLGSPFTSNPYMGTPVVPPTGQYSVTLAGRSYGVDTNFEPYRREAFRHRSKQTQRESLNFDNEAGEGVVNTSGLWRRGARDFILGAGQLSLDRRTSTAERFYKSKGINPWVRYQATLLNDTTQQYTTSNSDGFVNVMSAGKYVYYMEHNKLMVKDTTGGSYTYTSGSGEAVQLVQSTSSGAYTTYNKLQAFLGFNGPMTNLATGTTLTLAGAGGSMVTITIAGVYDGATYYITPVTLLTSQSVGWGDGWSATFPLATAQPVAHLPSGTFTSITHNGDYWYMACGTNGVYYGALGSIAATGQWIGVNTTYPSINLVRWVNDRLWGGAANILFAATAGRTPGTALDAAGTNKETMTAYVGGNAPAAAWLWTDIAGGASQVYASGYALSGTNVVDGAVYRTSIDTSNTQPSGMTIPTRALPLVAGEAPYALFGYLNYIFVGTNLGVRMCQTLSVYDPTATATGDLKSGPIIPNITQPVTLPVTSFTANGQYVYFAWSNYDGASTGIGRMDLTNFVEELAPAYASDLMVTGQGTVQLDWDPVQPAPLISVSGSTTGVWAQSASLVSSGYIQSGRITYDIPEPKVALKVSAVALPANGSIELDVSADDGPYVNCGSLNAGNIQYPLPVPALQGKTFGVQITLNADPTTGLGPTLTHWQLEAYPQVPSETDIMVVLQLYKVAVVDGGEAYYDPYGEYYYLDQLRRAKKIVWYTEGPLSAQVLIESIDWLPEKENPTYEKGYNSLAVVSLSTINGFNYTPTKTG